MVDEKPLMLKSTSVSRKKKKIRGSVCIIHHRQNKSDCNVQQIPESNFKNINEATDVRKAQGNDNKWMSDICCQVPDDYIYRICMKITHVVTRTL